MLRFSFLRWQFPSALVFLFFAAVAPLPIRGLRTTGSLKGSSSDLAGIVRDAASASPAECGISTSWGVDFRKCWGDMRDLSQQGVCSEQVFEAFLNGDFENVKFDAAGNSGATIITTLPKFIVKTVKDEELAIMQDALPKLRQDLAFRNSGHFRSAIAPICVAVRDSAGKAWVLMRKIIIERGTRATVQVHGDSAQDWFDLKGPKIIGNTARRDMKTWLNKMGLWGKKPVWQNKDPGFKFAFPTGVQLAGGDLARGAALALFRDSYALMENKMTDYSLFISLWEQPDDSSTLLDNMSQECRSHSMDGTWPLVIPTYERALNGKVIMLAMGIIDYTERTFRGYLSGKAFSTMRDPVQYRRWWMKMWPKFFKLPQDRLQLDGSINGTVEKARRQTCNEEIEVGDEIVAVQELKWKWTQKNGKWIMKIMFDGTGSDWKVPPGARGHVVDLIRDDKVVHFARVSWSALPDALIEKDEKPHPPPEEYLPAPIGSIWKQPAKKSSARRTASTLLLPSVILNFLLFANPFAV